MGGWGDWFRSHGFLKASSRDVVVRRVFLVCLFFFWFSRVYLFKDMLPMFQMGYMLVLPLGDVVHTFDLVGLAIGLLRIFVYLPTSKDYGKKTFCLLCPNKSEGKKQEVIVLCFFKPSGFLDL